MSSRDNAGLGNISTRAAKREQAARVGGDVDRVRQDVDDRQEPARPAPRAPEQATNGPAVAPAVGLPIVGGDLQALAGTFRSKKPAKEQFGTQLPTPTARRIHLARRILDVPLTDLTDRIMNEWLDSKGLPYADENGNPIVAPE